MTEISNDRFDAALAEGLRVIACAEPGAEPREMIDPDRLRGRPFFTAVEQLAADMLAGGQTITARLPDAGGPPPAYEIKSAPSDADQLAAAIQESFPQADIFVLSGDVLLEAALLDRNAEVYSVIGDHAEAWNGEAFGDEVYATELQSREERRRPGLRPHLSPYRMDDQAPDDQRFLLVQTQPAAIDTSRDMEQRLHSFMGGRVGIDLGAGMTWKLTPEAYVRHVNVHELGHAVSYLTGHTREHAGTPYGAYAEECRADAFTTLMAIRDDGPDSPFPDAWAGKRDLYAVTQADYEHWTSPVVRAAAEEGRRLHTAGRLEGMAPDEMMRVGARIARQARLDERDYDGFRACLAERTERSDRVAGAVATPAGDAAAKNAMVGYVVARTRWAVPADPRRETADAWADAMRAANPRMDRLLRLAEPMFDLETFYSGVVHRLDNRPVNATVVRGMASDINGAAWASSRLLSGEAYARIERDEDQTGLPDSFKKLEDAWNRSARVIQGDATGKAAARELVTATRALQAAFEVEGDWLKGPRRLTADLAGKVTSALGPDARNRPVARGEQNAAE